MGAASSEYSGAAAGSFSEFEFACNPVHFPLRHVVATRSYGDGFDPASVSQTLNQATKEMIKGSEKRKASQPVNPCLSTAGHAGHDGRSGKRTRIVDDV